MLATCLQASAVPATPFFFGQHVLYTRTFATMPPGLFDGLRIWGADGTTWAQLEPQDGRFDFTRFDAYVEAARTYRLDLMYTFGQTPRWASARPDEPGNTGLGAAAEPAAMAHWARYVGTVAARYKGRIGAYEIMNEPRVPEAVKAWSPGFFSGSVVRLAEMTAIAAATVRARDPSATIVCPAFDGFDGLKRLDTFLATGAGKHCDVIGFHYYLPDFTLGNLRAMVQATHRIAARHGLAHLPVWDTETGLLIAEAGHGLQPQYKIGALSKMFSSAEAARLAAKVIVVSQLLGVERTYWFAHDTSWMGSTVADKRQNALNPFGLSLAVLKGWLSGRTLHNCVDSAASTLCEVHGDRGKLGAVYWGPAKPPANWLRAGYASIAYLDGRVADLRAGAGSLPAAADDVVFFAVAGR